MDWSRSGTADWIFLPSGSSHPGTGQFRRFMAQAKQEFDIICVWEIFNPLLELILIRYSFEPTFEYDKGEHLTGFRWDKPAP